MGAKRIRKLVLLLLAVCVLTACGAKDEEVVEENPAIIPNAYFMGSECITAVQSEAGIHFTQLSVTESGAFVYGYAGFESVGTSMQTYAELLMAEENGFSSVNGETYRPAALPDFTAADGSVSLSRPTDNEKITVVRADWTADQCNVTISIQDPPAPEEPKPEKKKYGLSHVGAIEYLQALEPSVLELEGDSMEAYNIYITNGFTFVDGEACLRVEIYSEDGDTLTNVHCGSYYMSGDGVHIYRLYSDGRVAEMDQE